MLQVSTELLELGGLLERSAISTSLGISTPLRISACHQSRGKADQEPPKAIMTPDAPLEEVHCQAIRYTLESLHLVCISSFSSSFQLLPPLEISFLHTFAFVRTSSVLPSHNAEFLVRFVRLWINNYV